MAPVIKCMEKRELPFKFVLTGQHAETMDDLTEGFGIRKADDILVEFGESDTKRKLLQWLPAAWKAPEAKIICNNQQQRYWFMETPFQHFWGP